MKENMRTRKNCSFYIKDLVQQFLTSSFILIPSQISFSKTPTVPESKILFLPLATVTIVLLKTIWIQDHQTFMGMRRSKGEIPKYYGVYLHCATCHPSTVP